MAVLRNLNELTREQLIEQLMAAQKASERKITMKVTAQKLNEKTGKMEGTSGAISLYGLGRFPITLYRGQMERLLDSADAIRAFIKANEPLLAVKE